MFIFALNNGRNLHMEITQFFGFLIFLSVLTMGFWLMIFLLTFVIPYWVLGSAFEEWKLKRAAKKNKK